MTITDLEPTKLLAVIEDVYRTRWYRWSLDAPAPWRPMGARADWEDYRFDEIEYASTVHEGFDETGDNS
jgi:hypothetical protein